MADKLYINRTIYTKWRGGGYYQGTIVESHPNKKLCRILLQDGILRNVSWRDISTDLPDYPTTV